MDGLIDSLCDDGRRAAQMLLERLGGLGLPPRRLVMESRVVMRRSVAAGPGFGANAPRPASMGQTANGPGAPVG